MTNSCSYVAGQKSRWYLATMFGLSIGLAMGWAALLSIPSSPLLELTFWIIPAAGAGLGMGLGQWMLIRRTHKNAFLWIPATAIGFIAIIGSMLLLTMITNAFFEKSISGFFKQFEDWFIPWLVLLSVISPVAIIIGPFCQWLIVRDALGSRTFKEILKMCAGWIFATLLLGFMLFFTGSVFHSRSIIFNLLIFGVNAVPPALIFAQATIAANRTG